MSQGPITGAGYGYNPADTNNTALIQGDEGKLATEITSFGSPAQAMTIGPDGSVYFTQDLLTVWKINPNGVLNRVAGRYADTKYGAPNAAIDGADPLNTYIYPAFGLGVTPDDTLVIVRSDASDPPFLLFYPQRDSKEGVLTPESLTQSIPSEDGSEIYIFNPNGQHLATLDSLTGATKWAFTYDANNLVVKIIDAAGLTTTIQRDGSGKPTAIVSPYGQTTTLGLDANGFLNKVSNPANEATTMVNTSGGLLTSITGPLSDTYQVSYDNLGRVTQVSDPLGGGWTDNVTDLGVLGNLDYAIDIACTNSLGDDLLRNMSLLPDGDTQIEYFSGSNYAALSTTALNGNTTTYPLDGSSEYVGMNADPRFGSQVQLPGSFTLLVSNVTANVTIQRSASLATAGNPLSLTVMSNVTTVNGNTYNSVYTASNFTTVTTSPAGRTSSLTTDSLGRPIHLAGAGAPVFDLAYDSNGRPSTLTTISALGTGVATYSYDGLGQLGAITDALGGKVNFSYDAAGRLTNEMLSDGSLVSFASDSEDNPTSVNPPGRPAHTFQYDAVNSLTKYTPPQVGADESVTFAYDSERNVKQVSFPDGQTATFQHGESDRLEQAAFSSGLTYTYQYGTNMGPGYLERVAVTSSAGDAIQYAYTGPILTGVTWSGSVNGQIGFQLNANLVPASESVDGTNVAYSYDADGLMTQAGSLGITRDPASGMITGTSLGVVTDQRMYNDAGLLTNYVASASGVPIWSVSMSYDLIGRLTNKAETIGGITQTNGYVYDAAYRLSQVWLNGALETTYTYDTNGNRLTRNSEAATYDAQDRVLTYAGSSFNWSPNGTLQSRLNGGQTTDYTYDIRGALVSANVSGGSQISYVSDAEGMRIGKRVNGSLQRGWLWSHGLVAAQVDGSSDLTECFIYGADNVAPSYMITPGGTYRILSEQSGSVRLVVNIADGTIAQQLSYDEFGRTLSDSNPGFQPVGFDGGLYDADTGLTQFGARDYSSETGQWTARDPILFAGGQFSLYAFVGNDPINFYDPIGTGPNNKRPNNKPPKDKSYHHVLPDIEHEDWEYIKETSMAFLGWGGAHVAEHLQVLPTVTAAHTVTEVLEITDKGGQVVGAGIESLTGNALGRADYEARHAGNMKGLNSQNGPPFDPLSPSTWGWSW
jgi:RHS repeat-associated protein